MSHQSLIIIDDKFKEKLKKRGKAKMKKTKIILVATLGLCIISLMPAVVAKADARPISDFTDTNDLTGVAAWHDPVSDLIVFPHGFWVTDPGTENITNCEHSGSVLERDLKDGRIMYKINLHVKGAMMLIAYYSQNRMIFVGEMDYNFQATLIVDGEFGGSVPSLFEVWFLGVGEGPFVHITGSGTGVFIDDAAAIEQGFAPGATAKVKINQVGFYIPNDHPQYDPEYEPYMYPVEFVFFH